LLFDFTITKNVPKILKNNITVD